MPDLTRAFDVFGGSSSAGTSVGFYGSNGTAAQIWDVRKNSDERMRFLVLNLVSRSI